MTLEQFCDTQDRIAEALPRETAQAISDTLEDLQGRAVYYTSGPLTQADLRHEDHPFAKRHGTPQRDPERVNLWGGGVAGHWETDGPQEDDDGLFGTLENTDPKAPYLEQPDGGPHSTMFPRHPHEAAAREVAPRFEERMNGALVRSLEG